MYRISVVLLVAFFLGCDDRVPKPVTFQEPVGTERIYDNYGATKETATEEEPPKILLPLTISVTGFKNNSGKCFVAVYLGAERFNNPEFAVAKTSLDIESNRASWTVSIDATAYVAGLAEPKVSLAIGAYQDENENGRLDKSTFGIPTELYGFSQNPKRGYGPPKFSEAKVVVDVSQSEMPVPTIEIPIEIK